LPVWRHRRGDRAAARKGEGFYWYSLGLEGYFRDFENEVDRIFVGASLAVGCMKGAFRCRPKLKDKSLSKGALSRVSEVDPGFFLGSMGSNLFLGSFSGLLRWCLCRRPFWSQQPLLMSLGIVGLL
jgi:hypothetical protein